LAQAFLNRMFILAKWERSEEVVWQRKRLSSCHTSFNMLAEPGSSDVRKSGNLFFEVAKKDAQRFSHRSIYERSEIILFGMIRVSR